MQEVRTFVRETVAAFNKKDSDGICDLIMLEEGFERLERLHEALYTMTEDTIRSTVEAECKSGPRQFKELIANYLIFTIASGLDTSRMVDVYELLSTCYGSFLSLYQAQDAQWLTPLLMNISHSLVGWAVFADDERRQEDEERRRTGQPLRRKEEAKISDAATKHLSKAFSIAANDRYGNVENSGHNLRSTRLVQTLMNNIAKANVRLREYPMSQQVTHRYYVGRFHLYQKDLRRAERELAFAFRNCPDLAQDEEENRIVFGNTRLTLIYLTACRLCLGRMPSLQLLETYNLRPYFEPLMNAVKSGDLSVLEQTYSRPELMGWYLRREIFLLFKEKLRVLCLRSLIRRACLVSRRPTDPPQMRVNLDALVHVVQTLTGDASYDILDIEAMTASLLDQGYIKGYIHHEKRILVLGKTNPFPTVYSVEVMEELA
ncbi:hypothetical protein BGZ58_005390 [Dissophora ornata]|nr:hypothetical protein BGZ58_005390 [Dissophora ornata]